MLTSMTDGNTAAADIAYRINELCAIYPITPSSAMGEVCDEWSAKDRKNVWGNVPRVVEMQSEAGAAGVLHGALITGTLTTTFTSSQGLLLMIPEMYKIAGELLPTVFHVAARTLATHALSIFCDHSDIMAIRQTGFCILGSDSVQAVSDLALISYASTFESSIPFVHFFDGFRTSHEIMKIIPVDDETIKKMVNLNDINSFKQRGLNPDKPVTKGTAQNPDVFFQSREAGNTFYQKVTEIVEKQMALFAELTGRHYSLFEYTGAPDAERIIILMGSGANTARETIEHLVQKGEKVGMINVRLFRPFSIKHFIDKIPLSVKSITVLDRTKEPGAVGEPLYNDVITALYEGDLLKTRSIHITGGRYGLSSKEFRPCMVKAVLDELKKTDPKNHFTIGINDDVTHTSLEYDETFTLEKKHLFRGKFYGLGSDGTVSANKNSIKIIGENTEYFAQGYFEYDSKKSGSYTISHLRFGNQVIDSSFLIERPNFIACHQEQLLHSFTMLDDVDEGSVFLLNTSIPQEHLFRDLPATLINTIVHKKISFWIIDAYTIAATAGMGRRINTIMQTCFMYISGIFTQEDALRMIKDSITYTYKSKGEMVIEKNLKAVDLTLSQLFKITIPKEFYLKEETVELNAGRPDFVEKVTMKLIHNQGNSLPVSLFPVDGTYPNATTRFEKRNIALSVPEWNTAICIQCNKCVFVCPHACIRAKIYKQNDTLTNPDGFKFIPLKGKEPEPDLFYTLQVSFDDCTGCKLCVDVCPVEDKVKPELKSINMKDVALLTPDEKNYFDYFLKIPDYPRERLKTNTVKFSQFLKPLFEYSGACSGCGETPYIRLVTQLFGDRTLIANATGCSSIYGGNLPTSPWTFDDNGRGPAWANSLFEDNAEFGMGYRLSLDIKEKNARELLIKMSSQFGDTLVNAILSQPQNDEKGIKQQRENIEQLKQKLKDLKTGDSLILSLSCDYLIKKSVWIIGGDGWAYDIGFGGLDHVLASGQNVNVLVLDTEVYSNTGGQASKASPFGGIARFATSGKKTNKKDLGMMMMAYKNIYIASVAMGANDQQCLKAIHEAEAYNGPSLIIAYSHCIAHGMEDISCGLQQQKSAVDTGYWLLYRYNPDLALQGKNPLIMDSKPPEKNPVEFLNKENRFKLLNENGSSTNNSKLLSFQNELSLRWKMYSRLSKLDFN